jgi:hypothetical protein
MASLKVVLTRASGTKLSAPWYNPGRDVKLAGHPR